MSQNDELRDRSGAVDSADPLVDFLYHLLRDHLPAGVVEEILQKHVFPEIRVGDPVSTFCNGFLANYAKDVAARLLRGSTPLEPMDFIPTTTHCPKTLEPLRDDINAFGGTAHAILVRPQFVMEFMKTTDASFDRETERHLLDVGVVGYWHCLPVIQNRDMSRDWAVV